MSAAGPGKAGETRGTAGSWKRRRSQAAVAAEAARWAVVINVHSFDPLLLLK